MLRKKIGAKNYFVVMVILMAVTAVMVIAAFIVSALTPSSLGRDPYHYEIISVYEFEPWTFELENLAVSYPDRGIIVAVNNSDRKRSVLLLGNGNYEQNGIRLEHEDTGGIFMVLEYDLFDEIRGNNIFMPVEDQRQLDRVEKIFARQVGITPIWKDFLPLTFHKSNDLVYYYFITADGKPILPPEDFITATQFIGSMLVYTLIIAITMMVITILSPSHNYSRYWHHLGKTAPGLFSLALIPATAVLALGGEILAKIGSSGYLALIGYGTALLILLISARYGKIDYLDLGLRRDRTRHGYFLAFTAAALLFIINRGMPFGLNSENISAILSLPGMFIFIALPREMIWRGYIQAVLSRHFDPTRGLLAMVLLAVISRFLFLAFTEPWLLSYPYTYLELAVLVPGTAAILGYTYLRTENILSCALLSSLVYWLPIILMM